MQNILDGSPLEFFDTHCHFDFEDFDSDRDEIWAECQNRGIHHMLVPGVQPEQWPRMRDLCAANRGIYFAAGLHPCWLESPQDQNLSQLQQALRDIAAIEHCIAIGECGLDQYIDGDETLQEAVLCAQLEMAQELEKPVILHCRRAHNLLLRCLKQFPLKRGGILHAYSGSQEQAEQYWKMGFFLGIGGTITYERANKTRTAVKHLPLNALVLETDAPDMPLFGQQGERNSPLNVLEVAKTLAELRGDSLANIATQTTQNAKQLFGLI
ncbi:TatD family deoxyribonuclease [Saccharophagus sp. K07]|jgi:TatD DNase family protein|uniref:TatD family hydrolase n=1 Tax=Saccharophagus sp. K07 TaxID=2283636 RepID=UPI00165200E3|nr:TatD family hydrolase [Saccharophagus sp. K07]MBC6905404.1 TatD family deoxyribonuclease [Saccharophagus sp. K07]